MARVAVFLQNESFTGIEKRLNVRLKNLINIRICGGAFVAKNIKRQLPCSKEYYARH